MRANEKGDGTTQVPLQTNPLAGVSRETRGHLEHYLALLSQWQKRINLVSASTLGDGWNRHVVDSARFFAAAPQATRFADIGTGAGFPGLVIAHLLADQGMKGSVHLVESSTKKCAFLRTVIRETGLSFSSVEVTVHCGRIEAVLPNLPEVDVLCARALAPLDRLFDLGETVLRSGAMGVFAKGVGHRGEISKAQENWSFEADILPANPEEGSVLLRVDRLQRKT